MYQNYPLALKEKSDYQKHKSVIVFLIYYHNIFLCIDRLYVNVDQGHRTMEVEWPLQ